jgi:hypothetical protein
MASALALDSLTVARQRGILTRFPVRSLGRLRTREHKITKSNSLPPGSDKEITSTMSRFDFSHSGMRLSTEAFSSSEHLAKWQPSSAMQGQFSI